MGKRTSTFPDSFEVDVISLLRGQVDAIVHELAVAISDIQSGFWAEEAEDYLYGKLENLVPPCGSRARGCVSNTSAS
jgi:hypothetical protein